MGSDKKSNNVKKENLHKDHRSRLKARFMREGLSSFEDHAVLEMLLFYVIHMKDTNDTAHRLINEFGSLNKVLDAQYESLLSVEGIGKEAALFIRFVHDVMCRYDISKTSYNGLSDLDEIARYMVQYYKHQTVESLDLLLFDNKRVLYNIVRVCEGTASMVSIVPRQISNVLHKYNASSFIISHNHVKQGVTPSRNDIKAGIYASSIFDAIEFTLLDQLVVSGDDYEYIYRSVNNGDFQIAFD